ncbi:unnamed protein product [Prorocentrum cordatum]|uniref:Uncharacterized protein n=1 Tax=Prorocentrum cordatum TaxID=2364126 RepID=A0ABN9VB82_9DINO|nr:unnamed protein product [Polarella glacialis]
MTRWPRSSSSQNSSLAHLPDRGRRRRKAARRRGDEGASGQRCTICQAIALQAQKSWKRARTTKSGSPYNYIGTSSSGQTGESMLIAAVQKKVCNRKVLAQLPNPNQYTLHHLEGPCSMSATT